MKRGFALVELLVCFAVIGCLAGLLFPAVQAVREAARDVQCKSNLHQFDIEINRRDWQRDRIPHVLIGPKQSFWTCPKFNPQDSPLLPHSYQQVCWGMTRHHFIEKYSSDSQNIVLVQDAQAVHGCGYQFALYFDGSVRPILLD
jgi:type II secretory pathway pseudopilin PulG